MARASSTRALPRSHMSAHADRFFQDMNQRIGLTMSLGQHQVTEAQELCCHVLKLGRLVDKIEKKPELPHWVHNNI